MADANHEEYNVHAGLSRKREELSMSLRMCFRIRIMRQRVKWWSTPHCGRFRLSSRGSCDAVSTKVVPPGSDGVSREAHYLERFSALNRWKPLRRPRITSVGAVNIPRSCRWSFVATADICADRSYVNFAVVAAFYDSCRVLRYAVVVPRCMTALSDTCRQLYLSMIDLDNLPTVETFT